MRVLGLFLIGLIALTSVASLNSNIQFFKQLKNTEFGKTLLETIQVELKSDSGADAVTAIIKLLKSLSKSLVSDGKADSIKQAAASQQKSGQITTLNRNIAFITSSLKRDAGRVSWNKASVISSQKLLRQQSRVITKTTNALAENSEAQAKTTKTYRFFFTKLSAQIAGLAEARTILVTLQQRSLIQTDAQQFIQMSNNLQNIKFQHPKFQGFINILAQMMTNTEKIVADQRMVGRIIHLVDRLYGMLVQESAFLTFAYKVQMGDLRALAVNIRITISISNAQVSQQQTKIARLNASTNASQSRIRINKQRMGESVTELSDRKVEQNNMASAYDSRVQKRNAELKIVTAGVNIFKNQFNAAVRESLSAL